MSHLLARCMTGDSIAFALGILIAKYPAFRFYHAPVGQRGARWVAERIYARDPGLHTFITDDLRELMAALSQDRSSRGIR